MFKKCSEFLSLPASYFILHWSTLVSTRTNPKVSDLFLSIIKNKENPLLILWKYFTKCNCSEDKNYNIYEDDYDDNYESLKLWSIYYVPSTMLNDIHSLSIIHNRPIKILELEIVE